MTDRMQTQRAEFDAMAKLAEQYRRVTMTAVVDDDYPEVRHGYEGALATMLRAMKDNGRFEQGNRYGLAAPQPAPKPADDEPLFTVSMYGTAAAADKAREEWNEWGERALLDFISLASNCSGNCSEWRLRLPPSRVNQTRSRASHHSPRGT